MALTMRLDTREVDRRLSILRAPQVALMRALNRTAATVKTTMVREVAQDLGVPVGTVRPLINVVRATETQLAAEVRASAARLPLSAMGGVRGPLPSRGRGTVTVRGRRYPDAFRARMSSGHVGVFTRTGRRRLPITELRTASVAHVFTKHLPAGIDRWREQLGKHLEHEIDFLMSRG